MAKVGAESTDQLYVRRAKRQESVFWSIAGKHGDVTWRELVLGFALETWGAWLISSCFALALFFADGTVAQVDALFVAAAYSLSWYAATRSGTYDYKLRRHGNLAITVGYMFTGDIGFWGFWYYAFAQTLGTILGALTIGTMIRGIAGSLTKLPVPLPLEPTSSLTKVILFELSASAIIAFFMLLNEFLNTRGASDPYSMGEYSAEENEMRLRKNYKRATFRVALITFILVIMGYQFGVSTFSNVAYSGGLFSGWFASGTDLKRFATISKLHAADFAGSVWGDRNGAPAFYILGPCAGGVLAGIVFLLVFWLGVKETNGNDDWRNTTAKFRMDKMKAENAGAPIPMRTPLRPTSLPK